MNKRLVLLFAILALFLGAAVILSTSGLKNAQEDRGGLPSTSAAELRQMMKQPDRFVLLDVRGKDEFEAGHIEGAALIPLPELPDRFSELPKDQTIVVYCRSGRRSAQAIAFLQSRGFTNLLNLAGGINAWDNH